MFPVMQSPQNDILGIGPSMGTCASFYPNNNVKAQCLLSCKQQTIACAPKANFSRGQTFLAFAIHLPPTQLML